MNQNTPAAVDRFADLIDLALTDMAAPVVFVSIALLVWWRWGRYAAVMLGFAGAFTGLTRLGDPSTARDPHPPWNGVDTRLATVATRAAMWCSACSSWAP